MITIYEVPATKWKNKGKENPTQEVLDNCRVLANGDNDREGWGFKQALEELVANLNDDYIDTENCYLYIEKNEE